MTDVASIGEKIAKGAAWAVLMRIAIRSLGFLSTIVLARLLTPDDYGVVALAMIFVGLLEALTWFGFDVVLIQDQEASPSKYHTVWTLTLLRGALLSAAVYLGAPFIADLFDESRLTPILHLLACGPLIEGLASIGVVDFRKRLDFARDFRLMLIPRVVGFVVTLVLAVVWRDYWAMVVGMISIKISTVATGYAMHSYRPRIAFKYWLEVLSFSKWLLANNLLRYGYNRSDTLILGKVVESQLLGVYTVAYEISSVVLTELVAPIQRALFPGFSVIAQDPRGLRETYLAIFAVTLAVSLPIAVGIALTADLFVPLLLGEKWLQTIPLIQILCVVGIFNLGVANSGAVYVAVGKPRLTTLLLGVSLPLGLPFVVYGAITHGTEGAAFGMAGMAAVHLVINGFLIVKTLRLQVADIASRCVRPIAATTTMLVFVVALRAQIPLAGNIVELAGQLAAVIFVGAGVYCGADLLLWLACGRPEGPERQLITLVHRQRGLPSKLR